MNHIFNNSMITLYQKDTSGSFQIFEKQNNLINLLKLKNMQDYKNLEKYCTEINQWYLPINVLSHVTKHFPEYSNLKKISLIEDLLDYENKKYSYIIFSRNDDRYKLGKSKVKLKLFFINIIKNNEIFEICITHSIKNGKKNEKKIQQINSFYKKKPSSNTSEHSNLNSKIEFSFFNSNKEQYNFYKFINDDRFKINKPVEIFEEENNSMAVKLLTITGIDSVNIENHNNSSNITPTLSDNAKLSQEDIYNFFKEKDGKITLDELLSVYNNKLPLASNKAYTVNKILNNIYVEKFSFLYLILNYLFNNNLNSVECKQFFSDDNDYLLIIKNLEENIKHLNNYFNQELFYIKNDVLYLNITF